MKRSDRLGSVLGFMRSERGCRCVLIAAIVLGTLLRLALFVATRGHALRTDEPCYDDLATGWLRNGYLSWPDGKPSAYVGPVYLLLIMVVYRLFGHRPDIVYLLQIGMAGATIYLVYKLALLLHGSKFQAALGALGVALYPPLAQCSVVLRTEAMFVFLLAAMLLAGLTGAGKRSYWFMVLAGLIAGVGVLCRPGLLAYPFVIVMVLLLRRTWRPVLPYVAVLSIVMVTVVAPWTYRNYRVWGTFIPVATEGGFVLWSATMGDTGDFEVYRDPAPANVHAFLQKSTTEAESNAFFANEAMKNIRHDPFHFCRLALPKLVQFWFNVGFRQPPSKASLAVLVCNLILLALAIKGIGGVSNRQALGAMLLLILCFMSIHMVVFSGVRYALPVLPYVIVLSMRGVTRLCLGMVNLR